MLKYDKILDDIFSLAPEVASPALRFVTSGTPKAADAW
jgi:hypothetical protein